MRILIPARFPQKNPFASSFNVGCLNASGELLCLFVSWKNGQLPPRNLLSDLPENSTRGCQRNCKSACWNPVSNTSWMLVTCLYTNYNPLRNPHLAVGQNPVPLVVIKIGGYMGVHPPQNGGIGCDPWPFKKDLVYPKAPPF